MMHTFIVDQIKRSIQTKIDILNNDKIMRLIVEVSKECIKIYKQGKKIMIAGNGGSAADAQHIAGEFVSRFYFDRPGLASIALTTDTSVMTAIGNDYGYENIFSRQLEANGIKDDMFIGISTSGNSKNVLKALETCKEKKILTVGFTGRDGGSMKEFCQYCIQVPSKDTPRIQEIHIMIGHIICSIVEEELFGKGFK